MGLLARLPRLVGLGLASVALVVLLWVLTGKAGAAVTIGSDLTPDPVDSVGCGGACTKANTANPGQQVSSPIDGVVVRWRLRGQAAAGQPVDFKLRVLRPNAAGTSYTAINSSTTRTVSDTALTTHVFPAQQTLAAGDLIGLDVGTGAGNLIAGTSPMAGVTIAVWAPPLGDGQALPPSFAFEPADEILLNADVEPDCDNDGLGDETQDQNHSSCPPGTTPPGTTPPGTTPPGTTPTSPVPGGATCKGRQATIAGTDGADQIGGTPAADVIVGLGGPDVIKGGDQADVICGNGGDDVINGKSGEDLLVGDEGNDRLNGAGKNDQLFGGAGKDRLGGGFGRDRLFGGPGVDQLFGGFGKDTLRGGPGKDKQVQ